MDKREDQEKESHGEQEPAFTSRGVLSKLLAISGPQFPHLLNRFIIIV